MEEIIEADGKLYLKEDSSKLVTGEIVKYTFSQCNIIEIKPLPRGVTFLILYEFVYFCEKH